MGGGIGVKQFICSSTRTEPYVLKIVLGIKNTGTAGTTVAVKTLAKVNGVVWNNPNNPHTTVAPIAPNQWQEFSMNGAVPAPGSYTLWVKVDSENQQLESNESNNETTATTICR
jgi:subtilase family serine protease